MVAPVSTEEEKYELCIPTPDDFQGMAALQTDAFHERFACRKQEHLLNFQTYQRYYRNCPEKLQHCRIIKSSQHGGDDQPTIILAACQLMIRPKKQSTNENHPRNEAKLLPSWSDAEVFVEWIACHPDYRGKGIGSQMLGWAANYAKQELNVNVLSLFVVGSNNKARRLYERKGFVVHSKKNTKTRYNQKEMNQSKINKLITKACREASYMSPFRHLAVYQLEKDLTNHTVPIGLVV